MESPFIEAAPLYIELANAKIRDVHKGSNKTESWLSLEMYINILKKMESHLVAVDIDWKTMLQLPFILLSLERKDWLDHFNPLTSRSKAQFSTASGSGTGCYLVYESELPLGTRLAMPGLLYIYLDAKGVGRATLKDKHFQVSAAFLAAPRDDKKITTSSPFDVPVLWCAMEKPKGEKHFGDEYADRTRHREKENERDEIETIFLVEGDYGYITMRRRGVVDAPKHSPFFFLFPSASVSSASC